MSRIPELAPSFKRRIFVSGQSGRLNEPRAVRQAVARLYLREAHAIFVLYIYIYASHARILFQSSKQTPRARGTGVRVIFDSTSSSHASIVPTTHRQYVRICLVSSVRQLANIGEKLKNRRIDARAETFSTCSSRSRWYKCEKVQPEIRKSIRKSNESSFASV